MHSSNRSQPQLDFLRHSLSVLTNVASHQQLQSCLLTSDCIDVLIQQLQLYRDKEVRKCADMIAPVFSLLWGPLGLGNTVAKIGLCSTLEDALSD